MSDNLCPIFCWNVRGLNNPARCLAVCELVNSSRAVIMCVQETKLDFIDDALACEGAQ
jgi:exonuclease III